ncbi:MAG: hypothetical protein ABI321_23070 [Polyangia bacterium]
MPRFALLLAICSLACSLSVVAFFVGVPLGLLSVLLGFSALRLYPSGGPMHRTAQRAFVVGGLGLLAGLAVWFVHVRAIQTAYRIPPRNELHGDFTQQLAHATSPLPGAPSRTPAPPKDHH